ncbi:MAG: UMP kinase [Candidatus Kariarchaeaceae archaeon]
MVTSGTIVIKIGGSTLFDGDEIRMDLIKQWVEIIKSLRDDGYRLGIVIGGGIPARKFAAAARELGATNSYQDLLGIEAARQNARLFIAALPDAYPDPPQTYQELIRITASNDLVITGGFQPGQSTNAVASLFAEHMRADYLFNMSNVAQVYDKNPKDFPNAKPFDVLDYHKFSEILYDNDQLPGTYELFDHIGIDIVARSQIKLVFIHGDHPEYLLDTLKGIHRGTVVS